jgi:hypothetical protein
MMPFKTAFIVGLLLVHSLVFATVNGNVNNLQTQLPKRNNILEVLYFMNAEAKIFIPELVISSMYNDGTLLIKQCFADPTQACFTGAPVSQLPGSGQSLN